MQRITYIVHIDEIVNNAVLDIKENNVNNYNKYSFSLECLDNEGIIYHYTKYFNLKKINVEEMNTSTDNAPITGITLFKLASVICIPEDLDNKKIKRKLDMLSEQFNVNYNLSLLKSK